jgi:hypothetical protein
MSDPIGPPAPVHLDADKLLSAIAEQLASIAPNVDPKALDHAAQTALDAAYGSPEAHAMLHQLSELSPDFVELVGKAYELAKTHPGFWVGLYALEHHGAPLPADHPWAHAIATAFGASAAPPAAPYPAAAAPSVPAPPFAPAPPGLPFAVPPATAPTVALPLPPPAAPAPVAPPAPAAPTPAAAHAAGYYGHGIASWYRPGSGYLYPPPQDPFFAGGRPLPSRSPRYRPDAFWRYRRPAWRPGLWRVEDDGAAETFPDAVYPYADLDADIGDALPSADGAAALQAAQLAAQQAAQAATAAAQAHPITAPAPSMIPPPPMVPPSPTTGADSRRKQELRRILQMAMAALQATPLPPGVTPAQRNALIQNLFALALSPTSETARLVIANLLSAAAGVEAAPFAAWVRSLIWPAAPPYTPPPIGLAYMPPVISGFDGRSQYRPFGRGRHGWHGEHEGREHEWRERDDGERHRIREHEHRWPWRHHEGHAGEEHRYPWAPPAEASYDLAAPEAPAEGVLNAFVRGTEWLAHPAPPPSHPPPTMEPPLAPVEAGFQAGHGAHAHGVHGGGHFFAHHPHDAWDWGWDSADPAAAPWWFEPAGSGFEFYPEASH